MNNFDNDTKAGFIASFGLTLLLVTLKLNGSLPWGWWAVTLPTWGPPTAFLTIFFIYVLFKGGNK